jgi:RecA/RadA recombinase
MADKFKLAKTDKEFEEMFGEGFVDVRALARNSGFRSSGSLKVDSLLGGGFPRGTMVELWGPPQCLDGETVIDYETRTPEGQRKGRKGGTLERLYERFHGLPHRKPGRGKYPRQRGEEHFYALSIDTEGRIRRNRILNVVQSGIKECFCVETESGKVLVATAEHKFWTGVRFVPLAELAVGDTVYVHNNTRLRKTESDKQVQRLQGELRYIAVPDTIRRIEAVHERETYDLVMAEPFRNFVAAGIVVHNSGKSTLATSCLGNTLLSGGTGCYVDLERGLDLYGEADYVDAAQSQTSEERATARLKRSSWLAKNGIDILDPNFRIYDPLSGEELFRFLANVVARNVFDTVVVDSVAAILTAKQLEGDTGESHFGAVAKLLSAEMPRLLRLYRDNPNTNIIFINQARDKIGYMQQGQKSTGGHALEHYVGTKVRFRLMKREPQTSGDIITLSRVKIDKSRYASARELTIEISGARGLDVTGELLQFAEQQGYAHTSGAWRYFYDQPITPDDFKAAQKAKAVESVAGFVGKAQGKDAAKMWMDENDWRSKLYEEAVRVGIRE